MKFESIRTLMSKISIALAMGMLFFAQNAAAHATPVQYVPIPASRYQEMPEEIRVQFSERVKGEGSAIEVYRQDGTKVSGRAVVKVGDPYTMIAVTNDAFATSNGIFTVSWHVTSDDDGHYSQGAFKFAVGDEYLRTATDLGDPRVTYVRKWWESTLRVVLMICGVVLAARLWWLAQAHVPAPKAGKFAHNIVGGYFFLSFAVILATESHAAASHFAPMSSQLVMWLHILAKEAWLGAVMVMAIEYFRKQQDMTKKRIQLAGSALVVAISTGGYIMWLHLKDFDNLLITDWGRVSVVVLLCGCVTATAWLVAMHQKRHAQYMWIIALLGAVSLIVSSVWISFTVPPLSSAPEHIVTKTAQGVPVILGYATYPNHSVVVQLPTAIDAKMVPQVFLTSLDGGIGPNQAAMQMESPYGYGFSVHELMPIGLWDVKVMLPREGAKNLQGELSGSDVVVHAEIDSDQFLHDADVGVPQRKWDGFATQTASVVLGSILLLILLSKYVDSKNNLK